MGGIEGVVVSTVRNRRLPVLGSHQLLVNGNNRRREVELKKSDRKSGLRLKSGKIYFPLEEK